MSENTADILEEAVEVVEESVETFRNNPYILGGVAVVSAAVGVFAGYQWAKKRLVTHYDALLEEETSKAKLFYKNLYDKPPLEDLAKALVDEKTLDEAAAALNRYQGEDDEDPQEEKPDELEQISENVFVSRDAFDYQAALAQREANPNEPYVVSHVEYMENEDDHIQTTFTYFAGDDILCDENDESVDASHTIGEDAFSQFGNGSQDNNVVYIRNPHLEMDYEVIKSEGSYSREILGVGNKPANRGSRKFRQGDDE